MTWCNGRQLSTVATGGKTYSYEYDANGLRTRRTNSDGGYTLYYIVDGLTVGEQQYTASGSIRRTMKYLLDENNSPVGVSVRYPSYSAGTWDNLLFCQEPAGGRDCPLPLEWNKYRHAGGHLQVRSLGQAHWHLQRQRRNHLPDSCQCSRGTW